MTSASTSLDADAALPARPQGCSNLKLRQLSRRVSQRYDAAMSGVGLTGAQYLVLSHVLLMEPVKPSALAARLRLDASTLTRNLQPLVNEGWVDVQPGADGRSRLVRSTPAGQAKRREGQQAWKKAQLALNAALGPDRVARLHALLDECQALLESDED